MQKDNKRTWSIIAIAIVIALVVGIALWLWDENSDNADDAVTNEAATSEVEQGEEEPTLTELTDEPANFIGRDVTVAAEVDDVLSNRMIRVSNDLIGNELLVIAPQALDDEQAAQAETFLTDNANVRVDGTVRRATAVEVEEDYGLEIGSDMEAEFEDTVVLVADSITFTDQGGVAWDFDLFDDENDI